MSDTVRPESVVVRARPESPYWYVFYYDATGRHRKSTSLPVAECSQAEAERIVRQMLGVPDPSAASAQLTLAWVRDEYLPTLRHEGLRPSTIQHYRSAFNRFIACFGKDTGIADVQAVPHIKQFQDWMLSQIARETKEGAGDNTRPSTVNSKLRDIQSVFSRLADAGHIERNPFKKHRKVREVRDREQHFEPEQIRELFEAMKGAKSAANVRLARILAHTGRRVQEIMKLHRSEVDIAGRRFLAENSKHKDRRKRWIEIPGAAFDDFTWFLETRRGDQPFKVCTASAYSQWFKRWLRRTSLPQHLHPHSLRHSLVTEALRNGVPAWYIKEYLDHSTIAVTEGYAHTGALGAINLDYDIGGTEGHNTGVNGTDADPLTRPKGCGTRKRKGT